MNSPGLGQEEWGDERLAGAQNNKMHALKLKCAEGVEYISSFI